MAGVWGTEHLPFAVGHLSTVLLEMCSDFTVNTNTTLKLNSWLKACDYQSAALSENAFIQKKSASSFASFFQHPWMGSQYSLGSPAHSYCLASISVLKFFLGFGPLLPPLAYRRTLVITVPSGYPGLPFSSSPLIIFAMLDNRHRILALRSAPTSFPSCHAASHTVTGLIRKPQHVLSLSFLSRLETGGGEVM